MDQDTEHPGSPADPTAPDPHTPGPVSGWRGTAEAPAWARTAFPAPDYLDVFTLRTAVDATAEEWARAMFGDTPSPAERLIWAGLLGLRLTRQASPDLVAGWRVRERTRESLLLEAESPGLRAQLLMRTADGTASLATALDYRTRWRKVEWERLSAVHRRLIPAVLRRADTSLRLSRAARSASPATH